MRSFKPRPNYFWSIISVAGVLLLVGIFAFVTLHAQDLVKSLKEQFELVFELSEDVSEKQRKKLEQQLAAESMLVAESVRFQSKEEGLQALSKDLGENLADTGLPNPLFDIVTCRVKSDRLEITAVDSLREQYLASFSGIEDIYYERSLIEQVTSNLDRLALFFVVAGLLLTLLALTLIHNSIRLAIYANRFLIKNMELVGASWGFIRRPFLAKSARHGLTSSALAIGLLAVLWLLFHSQVPDLRQFVRLEHLGVIVLLMLIVGFAINFCSTYYVVTRFLNMRMSELHS